MSPRIKLVKQRFFYQGDVTIKKPLLKLITEGAVIIRYLSVCGADEATNNS